MMIWEMEAASGSWCKLLVPAYTFHPSRIFSRVLQEPQGMSAIQLYTWQTPLAASATHEGQGASGTKQKYQSGDKRMDKMTSIYEAQNYPSISSKLF